MTITKEQLDVVERRANAYNETDLSLVPVECPLTLRLVAIARAALAWRDLKCDPPNSVSSGCNGWFHTAQCEERVTEAGKGLHVALRGAP